MYIQVYLSFLRRTNNRTQQSTYKLHVICERRKPKSDISSNLSGTVLETDVGELSCREMYRYLVASNGYFGGHEFTDIRMHIRYKDPNTCLSQFLN